MFPSCLFHCNLNIFSNFLHKIFQLVVVNEDTGPLRYMAPEALSERSYSSKSDIWSFGVTLWEIMSGGEVPYRERTAAQVAMDVVMDGLRLEKPPSCDTDIHEVMALCWVIF